jgi:hypothetical protein
VGNREDTFQMKITVYGSHGGTSNPETKNNYLFTKKIENICIATIYKVVLQ